MNGATVLAQASYSTGDMNESTLSRNFMLFYKGVNSPNGDYSVQTVAPTTAGAEIMIRNLQWGVKIYDATYPLSTDANSLPSC